MVKKNPTRKVHAPLVGCLQINYMGFMYVPERVQDNCAAVIRVGQTHEIVAGTPGPVKDAPEVIATRLAGSMTGREYNTWRRTERQRKSFS